MVLTLAKQDYVTVYLSAADKKKFKSMCALEGEDMSAIAAKLIQSWMKSKESDRTNDNGAK